jgi:AcrR family transcriptional regulator
MYAKSAATIAKIYAAAQSLFLSKNYADVTMTEIAATSRVTKGALYYHFPSKEALYVAMMTADLQEKQALFRPVVASSGTCRQRLRRLTQVFLQLPREKRDLIKLVRRDVNIFNDPLRDQLIRSYQATLPEQIEMVVRDGIRDGELAAADPRLLSWHYVATVEVILTRYAEIALGNQDAMLDFVINLFFSGAGKTTA